MRKFLLSILLIIIVVVLYARYATINGLKVKEYIIKEDNIADSFNGLKIVHFSDFLYNTKDDLSRLDNVINKINEQKPDIVVFTGNIINNDNISDDDKNEITFSINKIESKYKYAILGDKDTDKSKEILSSFKLLENTSEYIFNEDSIPIVIVGGDNITEDILPKDENITYNYIIALIHKPDDIDTLNINANLVLAGHSLGGQIRLPFWGALIKSDGAKKYSDDTYSVDDKKLYISYGLGLGNTGFRLFNSPSINVYRLTK